MKNTSLILGSLLGGGAGCVIGCVGGFLLGMLMNEYSPKKTKFSEKYELEASKENNNINSKIKE